jgi:hypothetical protein
MKNVYEMWSRNRKWGKLFGILRGRLEGNIKMRVKGLSHGGPQLLGGSQLADSEWPPDMGTSHGQSGHPIFQHVISFSEGI